MSSTTGVESHREFLNGYYGWARHIYDVTRKYYLFGRDEALRELSQEVWSTLVEVGPGTGRNLRVLRRLKPEARLAGVEASDAMLAHARARCPWAKLVHGFAEDFDYSSVFGEPPDRILFSYCLSMVGDGPRALRHARRSLAPDGDVVVVDFADMGGLVQPARRALRSWLHAYHVEPLNEGIFGGDPVSVRYGPGRYYAIARFGKTDPQSHA